MESFRRALSRVTNKMKLPFRALVKSSSDALKYKLAQGLSRVHRQDVKAFQHYGLVSRLPGGTEVLVIPRLGQTGKLVIVSEAHKTAITLSEGDVALERESGEHVLLRSGQIVIQADSVEISGAGGKALVTEDLLALFNAHAHSGVSAGESNSGPPLVAASTQKTVKTKAL